MCTRLLSVCLLFVSVTLFAADPLEEERREAQSPKMPEKFEIQQKGWSGAVLAGQTNVGLTRPGRVPPSDPASRRKRLLRRMVTVIS